MRYHHHSGVCHGYEARHSGCGNGYGYGPAWACGRELPFDEPGAYGFTRGRRLGYSASRATSQQRLESYLDSLRDEMRAVEQDLSDLRGDRGEQTGPTV